MANQTPEQVRAREEARRKDEDTHRKAALAREPAEQFRKAEVESDASHFPAPEAKKLTQDELRDFNARHVDDVTADRNRILEEQRKIAEAHLIKGKTPEQIAEDKANADEAQRRLDDESAARTRAANEHKAGLRDERLAEAEARVKPEGKDIELKLKRDHWIGEDRHFAGAKIKVDVKEARRLIDAGVASRTDPLPGEL